MKAPIWEIDDDEPLPSNDDFAEPFDIEDDELFPDCETCNATGEGRASGTICETCGGSGVDILKHSKRKY